MKPFVTCSILLSALCATGGVRAVETPVPETNALPVAVAIDRYEPMISRSMFAPATPPPAPPAMVDVPSFAQDLYIEGIAQVGGKDFVTVSTRDRQTWFSLLTGESHDGITFTSIDRSEEVGKSKVTLKKGEEFGTIGFDEASFASAGGAAPPPGPQGGVRPPVPGQGGASRPGAAPGVQTPAGLRRPRRGAVVLPPAGGAPAAAAQTRNRQQPIQSQPTR